MKYLLEKTKRTPVTSKWLYENPDTPAYIFDNEADAYNLDPWIQITGVDRHNHLLEFIVILEFDTRREMFVTGDFTVYVQERQNEI